ncbi:MAG: 30S ribosomal protein S8 [Chloroflexota bacterium]
MVNDPVADLLTRIRNAIMARHDSLTVASSKMKLGVTRILKEQGFISDYNLVKVKTYRVVKIQLKYINGQPAVVGLERVSKPSLRVYVKRGEIPRVYGGLGITIVSTPKGVMTGQDAWRHGLGGELLCYVW